MVDLFFYNNIYVITKNQKQNNRECVICHVNSMVYTLTDHSSRPMSARGFAQFNIIVIIVFMFNSINSFMSGLSIRASFDSFYSLILCFEEIVKLSWPLT